MEDFRVPRYIAGSEIVAKEQLVQAIKDVAEKSLNGSVTDFDVQKVQQAKFAYMNIIQDMVQSLRGGIFGSDHARIKNKADVAVTAIGDAKHEANKFQEGKGITTVDAAYVKPPNDLARNAFLRGGEAQFEIYANNQVYALKRAAMAMVTSARFNRDDKLNNPIINNFIDSFERDVLTAAAAESKRNKVVESINVDGHIHVSERTLREAISTLINGAEPATGVLVAATGTDFANYAAVLPNAKLTADVTRYDEIRNMIDAAALDNIAALGPDQAAAGRYIMDNYREQRKARGGAPADGSINPPGGGPAIALANGITNAVMNEFHEVKNRISATKEKALKSVSDADRQSNPVNAINSYISAAKNHANVTTLITRAELLSAAEHATLTEAFGNAADQLSERISRNINQIRTNYKLADLSRGIRIPVASNAAALAAAGGLAPGLAAAQVPTVDSIVDNIFAGKAINYSSNYTSTQNYSGSLDTMPIDYNINNDVANLAATFQNTLVSRVSSATAALAQQSALDRSNNFNYGFGIVSKVSYPFRYTYTSYKDMAYAQEQKNMVKAIIGAVTRSDLPLPNGFYRTGDRETHAREVLKYRLQNLDPNEINGYINSRISSNLINRSSPIKPEDFPKLFVIAKGEVLEAVQNNGGLYQQQTQPGFGSPQQNAFQDPNAFQQNPNAFQPQNAFQQSPQSGFGPNLQAQAVGGGTIIQDENRSTAVKLLYVIQEILGIKLGIPPSEFDAIEKPVLRDITKLRDSLGGNAQEQAIFDKVLQKAEDDHTIKAKNGKELDSYAVLHALDKAEENASRRGDSKTQAKRRHRGIKSNDEKNSHIDANANVAIVQLISKLNGEEGTGKKNKGNKGDVYSRIKTVNDFLRNNKNNPWGIPPIDIESLRTRVGTEITRQVNEQRGGNRPLATVMGIDGKVAAKLVQEVIEQRLGEIIVGHHGARTGRGALAVANRTRLDDAAGAPQDVGVPTQGLGQLGYPKLKAIPSDNQVRELVASKAVRVAAAKAVSDNTINRDPNNFGVVIAASPQLSAVIEALDAAITRGEAAMAIDLDKRQGRAATAYLDALLSKDDMKIHTAHAEHGSTISEIFERVSTYAHVAAERIPNHANLEAALVGPIVVGVRGARDHPRNPGVRANVLLDIQTRLKENLKDVNVQKTKGRAVHF